MAGLNRLGLGLGVQGSAQAAAASGPSTAGQPIGLLLILTKAR